MHNFSTILIDEITVQVYFDYEPEQPQTHDCPSYPSEVIISTVLIDDAENKDVLFVLSSEVIEKLELECEQHLVAQHYPDAPNEPD